MKLQFLFRDQEWLNLRESALESEQEFTNRQDPGKSVRKQPKCQSQKEQYNSESLERKSEYPPQAVLHRIFVTLPTGIILQVFMNTNISSTFPSYQPAGSHGWCQAAEELSAEPSTHRRLILCSAQCLAKHCMGTTEQQTWQKAKESPVESKKIFPLWVLKSNRMQLEQQNMLGRSYIEGTCVHTRDSRA